MAIPGIATTSRNKERRKKPDELLASVVRETAVGAAVNLLKTNEKFVFPSGTAWVMLGLVAEDLGGLNRRQSRDEAKGSIIKLIEADQIKTVATAEMLAEEVFGIIPTPETLARMEEYSLLTNAEYAWAVVWRKGDGDLHVDFVGRATFTQAQQVSAGTMSLEQAVGEKAWADHSGVGEVDVAQIAGDTEDPVTEPIDVVSDSPDLGDEIFDAAEQESEIDEDEPVFDDPVTDEDEPVFADEEPVEPAPVQPEAVEPDSQDLGIDEVDDADAGVNEDHGHDLGYEGLVPEGDVQDGTQQGVYAVDSDHAHEVIARRFMSEDLDLGIRLDEFDATFAIGAPAVRIEVPEGATEWLGDQISQLNRQANADLAGLRFQHEDELRALYVNLMSEHIQQVIRSVATDREGSRYSELMASIEAKQAERATGKDERIRRGKAEVLASHEEHAELLAAKAAADAKAHYKDRNRARIEREQADVGVEIEREIESSHTHELTDLLRIRRNDAGLKLQVGQTEVFKVLAEKHRENLDAEQERLDVWKGEIQRIVEDNRSNDVARANALAEQLARTDELGAARAEHEQALQAQRTEFDDRRRRLEGELTQAHEDIQKRLDLRDSEWRRDLEVEKERTGLLNQQLAEQRAENQTIRQDVQVQYELQVANLRNDRDAMISEVERASVMQGHYSKMMIALLIALPLLVGIAGFLLGMAF